eukprot:scaffold2020_cov21-Tisochrysis_lutea.AAC.1
MEYYGHLHAHASSGRVLAQKLAACIESRHHASESGSFWKEAALQTDVVRITQACKAGMDL